MSDPYGYEDGLIEVEAENPQTFTWGEGEYPWIAGEASAMKTLGFGGFEPGADLIAVVRKSHFKDATLPVEKQSVTANLTGADRVFSIDRIDHDPTGVFMVWTLNDPNKGA